MKKLLMSAAIAAMFGAMIPAAQAAVGSAGFNVTATLTPACTVGAIGNLAFGAVTAFVAPVAPTTTAFISCTRTLGGVTAVFDTVTGTSTALSATPSAGGLLSNGLFYTITTAKGAVTSGAAATNALIGGADTFTYTLTGGMLAQPGTCAGPGACAGTDARTLTLSF